MSKVKDPIREWREQFGRQMLNLDFEPLSDAPFQASFQPIFDGMRMVRSSFSPGLTVRDKELVRDGDDSFTFIISQSKGLTASQRGRSVEFSNGEATLVRVNSAGIVGKNRHFKFLAMMIPFAELHARIPQADDLIVRRVQRRSEPLQLLRAYIRSLEKGRLGYSDSARETICRHIIDLVGISATVHSALGESELGAISAARAQAVFQYIEEHFREPSLSVTSAAQALQISPRYLQKLLEQAGTAFTFQVNELRLKHALSQLQLPGIQTRISDIALRSGFSDLSHFNRLFRSRFGETPGAARSATRSR